MTVEPGARLGPYEVIEAIGAGGMGEVYRARDLRLGRLVAVKVLRGDAAADPDRIERFEREARSASALNHPNIVTIHDVGVEGALPYLAMEWVEGSPLRSLVERGRPQPLSLVVSVGAQIADGLAKAHASGIVHRDLKPDNVMLTPDGLVKILDFGLAKLVGEAGLSQVVTQSGQTAAGTMLGTVGYMSPEQVAGAAVDYRSDQFAVGLILYELAAGSRAFDRDTAPQTLAAIIEDEPPPLETRNPRVPPQLARIVARCLSKRPADRYESTRDLARDLRDLVHESSTARTVAARPRSPGRIALGAALVAAAVFVGWWLLGRPRPDARASDVQRVVAVLPFRDLTGNAERAYFAAGVTEEIRGQLTKVRALRLVSRSAVQRYGDSDLRRLRSELGAGSAVEGSVRLDAQRVRVSVELVDTETEQTLWSEQYDRTLDDVLSVQSEVALRIAAALNATLSAEERTRVARPPTTNPEAYQIYLRSQELSPGERHQNLRAIELLQRALALDPSFAAAQARLASRTYFLAYYDDPKYVDIAIARAQRAVEMDPNLAGAHVALASAYAHKGWATRARPEFLKAQDLDGAESGPVSNLAVLESEVLGRHDEALAVASRLLQIRPVGPGGIYHITWPMLFLRDDATTERWLSESTKQRPDFPRLQYLIAALHYLRGDEAAAVARARRIVEEHPAFEEGIQANTELAFLTGAPDAEPLVERLFRRAPGLETGPLLKQESHQVSYAHLLMKRGDRTRANALLANALARAHAALAAGNEHQRVPFEIAAVHALRGEKDQALEWLEKAHAAGYNDYSTVARHPVFESVRPDPRFRNVLGAMQNAITAMRERSTVLARLRAMPFPTLAAGR
jgi:TolB-like protein